MTWILVIFMAFIAIFLCIWLAKTFPTLGIVLGAALMATACYFGYYVWHNAKSGLEYLLLIVVAIPILWGFGAGLTMFRVGLRVSRGESISDIEDQVIDGADRAIKDVIERN